MMAAKSSWILILFQSSLEVPRGERPLEVNTADGAGHPGTSSEPVMQSDVELSRAGVDAAHKGGGCAYGETSIRVKDVIPPCGTFEYVVTVPASGMAECSPCPVGVRDPVEHTGDELHDARLVGLSPRLEIIDAGLTPEDPASSTGGIVRPKVLRSRMTLSASKKNLASVRAVSFHVDRSLTLAWRPGDLVHLSRTNCCGLGISVIREGILVVAVGAITSVPLGSGVQARIPWDLAQEAEDVFRKRDSRFRLPEIPLELRVGNQLWLSYGGRNRMECYEAFVVHGFTPDEDGKNECAAISRIDACSCTGANASALLLETDPLEVVPW